MEILKQYVKENKKSLKQIFDSMSSDETIEATKVYAFLQSAFDTREFKFLQNGRSFFSDEENSEKMETLIEQYYLSRNQGETKFYMYRVTFQFNEVIDIVRFWLAKSPTIQVVYKNNSLSQQIKVPTHLGKQTSEQKQQQQTIRHQFQNNKQSIEDQQQKSDNEFMPELSDIPQIIKNYKNQISKYLQNIQKDPLNEKEIQNYREKITELETKIRFLEERLKIKNQKQKKSQTETETESQEKKTELEEENSLISPRRSLKSVSPSKIETNLKSIFQFYAKQLHVTGVKASFERIEHETNRINYQKLVHFLKEYKIFPQQSKDQKKLHQFYVKCSSNTRDLTFEGFMNLLQKLSQIIIKTQNGEKSKFQTLKIQIIEQRRKNKVYMNPFHSLQKQDFRIDKATLKYAFKLIPINGKDPQQISSQLQVRKQIKLEKKNQRQQQQMHKKIRYIKKLSSIDPYHPLVQKNKHLIRQKSVMESEPIASMDNIEMYRDRTFDLKMLGIEEPDQPVRKVDSPSRTPVSSNNSYVIKNRAREIQKLQVQKMRSIMSHIIQKSNAKLQKLGISPSKRSNIS